MGVGPIGSETDQLPESRVEPGSGGWVGLTVGSEEHESPLGSVFHLPSVLVEEPVVAPAQQDQMRPSEFRCPIQVKMNTAANTIKARANARNLAQKSRPDGGPVGSGLFGVAPRV